MVDQSANTRAAKDDAGIAGCRGFRCAEQIDIEPERRWRRRRGRRGVLLLLIKLAQRIALR